MTDRSPAPGSHDRAAPDLIYHVALLGDWEEARRSDTDYRRSTRGRSLGEVGFIHCSLADQVSATAARHYQNDEVVVLAIDPSAAGAPVVLECVGGATEPYPHLYGPLPFEAVVATLAVDDPRFVVHVDAHRSEPVAPPGS